MKKELNYASPLFCKTLHDYGILWKASAYWNLIPGQNIYVLKDKLEVFRRGYPAYNVTELGHLIPFGFFNTMKIHKYLAGYFKVKVGEKWKTFQSEADCRAFYLIQLIESGDVKIKNTLQNDPQKVTISKNLPIPTTE